MNVETMNVKTINENEMSSCHDDRSIIKENDSKINTCYDNRSNTQNIHKINTCNDNRGCKHPNQTIINNDTCYGNRRCEQTNTCFNNRDKYNNNDTVFSDDEYARVMHNLMNEGVHSDFIFEETYDEHTVPIMYTEEEDNQIMNEMHEMMFIPTPKQQNKMNKDVAPVCIVKIQYIGGVRLDRPLICLLDTGSTGTMVQQRCLPPILEPNQIYQIEKE